MEKKITYPKAVEEFALFITGKVVPHDKVDVLARKINDDYFAAKNINRALLASVAKYGF
jgi:hypothetical protein